MVFDGPGEELAVVALWIKVQPTSLVTFLFLNPQKKQIKVNKSKMQFRLYLVE